MSVVAMTCSQGLAIAMGTWLTNAAFVAVQERFMNAVATTSCRALAIATGTWLMSAVFAAVQERFMINDILPGACDCDGNVVDECGVWRERFMSVVATTSCQALAIATGT